MGDTERVSITSTVPVGQPLYGASFGQAVKRFFKGYVKFSGRASRSEFWWAMLFTFLISLVVQIPFWIVWSIVMVRATSSSGAGFDAAAEQEMLGLSGIMLLVIGVMVLLSLAIVLPTYAVMWRRLQDANFHGAFTLLSFAGLGIVPLVMCALPSNPLGVRFDPAYAGQAAAYGYDQSYAPPVSPAYGQSSPYGSAPQASPPYGQPAYGQQPYGQPSQPYSQGYQQGTTSAIPQSYGGQSYGGTPYGQQPEGQQQP